MEILIFQSHRHLRRVEVCLSEDEVFYRKKISTDLVDQVLLVVLSLLIVAQRWALITRVNEGTVDKSGRARLHLEPQVEQLLGEEQLPQEELAVLLNFPPTEKAKADMTR